MKKLLVLAFLLLPLVAVANPIACAGTFSVAAQITAGACSVGDVAFTFNSLSGYTGTLGATISTNAAGYTIVSFADFTGGSSGDLASSFALSYTISLLTNVAPASTDPTYYDIVKANLSLQDDNYGTGSATETLSAGATGSMTCLDTAGSTCTTKQVSGFATTSLTVTDTFTLTTTGVYADNNTFTQADTSGPEPGTLILMGSAFLGLGIVSRKRRKKA